MLDVRPYAFVLEGEYSLKIYQIANLIKLKKICISKMYYRQLFNLTLKNIYPRLPWNQVARVAQG